MAPMLPSISERCLARRRAVLSSTAEGALPRIELLEGIVAMLTKML